MLKEAGILFAITLIAGLMLGVVNELTKEPIRIQQEKAIQEACRAVFADAASFEKMELNKTTRAIAIFNAIKISKRPLGSLIIRNTIAAII